MAEDLRIGVLGPMTAVVGGRQVPLGGPRQRAVLAVLVAARGRPVTQEALIARAWDGRNPPSPATLHSYVAALRKALEPGRAAGRAARVLVREHAGYALRIAPRGVDAERFTALAARGGELLRAGDAERAAAALDEALALWRGRAYADFAGASFAAPESARLHGLRRSAQEDLFAAELARGRHAAVVGDLEKHAAEEPLGERGWELLALALYRAGRQGDALAALRRARRVLAEELGVDPGPSLRRLEAAVLAQDAALAAPVPSAGGVGGGVVYAGAAPGTAREGGDGAPADPGHGGTALEGTVLEGTALEGTGRGGPGRGGPGRGVVPYEPVPRPADPYPAAPHGDGIPHGDGVPRGDDPAGGAVAAGVPRGRNLPFPLTGLVGREDEKRQVAALLAEHRLVTLTGPGGIGKTRLMLDVAHARADGDGPWLVELADLEDPDPRLVAVSVADALGIRDGASAARVAEVLGDRGTLLVLDNCEHVREAAAGLAAELLARCGGLRVLVTSREPLGLTGEAVYEVPPLTAGAGAELFLSRARAVTPGWAPGEGEARAAERICAELDGLPLAIELAAAQCRVLSVEQISRALDDRFAVLVGGPGTGPVRHRALRAAVEWSHRLLTGPERAAFHRLGVFAGSFDLDAATAVCGGPVLAELAALVRKSLLTAETGTSPRRYRMLETLKQYARRQADPAELAAAQAAHRAWVLTRASTAARLMEGPHAARATERTDRDQPEIRQAFTSALLARDGAYALRLGGALMRFWYRSGHVAEGLGWLGAALELTPDGEPGPRARALIATSALHYLKGDFATAARAASDAARHARDAGDTVIEAQGLAYRALFEGLSGTPGTARRAEAAVELARVSGERWLEAEALMVLGMLLRADGQGERAREVLTHSITLAVACGHRFVQASSSWLVMKSDLDLGRAGRALDTGLVTLRALEDDQDVTGWLVIAHTTAAALARCGRPGEGAVLLGAVEERGRRVGFSPALMDPADGPLQSALVRAALPPRELERCLAEGGRMTPAEVTGLLAAVAAARGDRAEAAVGGGLGAAGAGGGDGLAAVGSGAGAAVVGSGTGAVAGGGAPGAVAADGGPGAVAVGSGADAVAVTGGRGSAAFRGE
ncbi:AfsR/SARP family transcriptional regulator [Streptomyces rubrolavendulae]|uniref:Putative HTH-type transcriptional regulator n=1 Tax=Streptomyces rubrolavendulae TaxID=285473 RepID=A0A1D8G885_9ACTN|nr:BTAD domain-containing putative transcriptional regulator [Streptomyces rubrolavendulae]AOT61638.1 Putative HTH-type transcriptional regulator [Streptomyces rubrolavendulae]